MKIFSIGMLCCLIVATSIVSYAQHIDSVKTTDSRCGNSGTLTIYATGGVAPLTYQIYSGPDSLPAPQGEPTFESLSPGTYSLRVVDNAGHADTVTNKTVGGSYTVMNPTATALPPYCPGSTDGSIKLTFPSNQGRAPFTYTIVSGPTMLPPSNTTSATTYTYTGLDAGDYQVRVMDSCGNFQTRNATVNPTPANPNSVNAVWTRSESCDSMIFYIQPSSGSHFPHTMYAYKDGDTSLTPEVHTFTGSDLVHTPGIPQGQNGNAYKWTLPLPSTFCGGTYKFRFTDDCGYTTALKSVTVNTYTVNTTNASTCSGNDINISNINGYTYPVQIKITPQDPGGVVDSLTITDTGVRSATFVAPATSHYLLTLTDACDRSCSQNIFVDTPHKSISVFTKTCSGNNLDSTAAVNINIYQMLQPLTVDILSGPASYTSESGDININQTYPITLNVNSPNPWFGILNMPVGDYIIKATDACGDTSVINTSITAANVNAYTFSNPTIGGCSGARYIRINSVSSCGGLTADVVNAATNNAIAVGVGVSNGNTIANVPPGEYYIYYFASVSLYPSLFPNPNRLYRKPNDTTFGVVHIDTVTVNTLPSSPIIAGLAQAKCSSQVNVRVIPDSTSGATPFAFEIINGPGGYTAALQSSPEFDGLTPGTYTLRISDSCGNSGIQNLSVSDMPTAAVQSTNPCVGEDETLSYNNFMPYYNYYWLLPDSSISTASTLNFNPVEDSDTGTYTLVIKSTIGACADSSIASVTIMDCSVLPINLLYFNANKEGQQVKLDWATAMESNIKGFGVEHSSDSKKWMALDFINSKAANGNSNTKLEYSFIDEKPFASVNYYRLKQTDFDGKYRYSVVRQISMTDNVNPEIHPNPAKDYVIVSNLNGSETVRLIDINGKLIKEVKANNNELTLILDGLSNGNYQLQVVQKNGNITNHKIVVAK